ncbi:protein adenylyltransferase SelO [Reichenbachiella agarivorans]
MQDLLKLDIHAIFTEELPADSNLVNYPRQVEGVCYSWVDPKTPSQPQMLHLSQTLVDEWKAGISDSEELLKVMSGTKRYQGFQPYAMCYGGHQFGHWAGQLGDGRAINIADVLVQGQPMQLQLKGAGPTPYSRTADGFAVLRSSIREYLCSEAMHHLGVPTTRALSLVKTGDLVMRDMLYNGNPAEEQGAIVCRVAPSFIRFGNFQIFAARGEKEILKQLVDHTIAHHYAHLGSPSKETYLAFFQEVLDKTKNMIVHWQRVGFVHGVMNTDNLSILGLTIDYGPYGWLEDYNPGWTPNTTDAQHSRYRFGNQPNIAVWNLVQLANALYPLIEEVEPLQAILDGYKDAYMRDYHAMMTAKLGLYHADQVEENFINQLTELMTDTELDMTIFFRELSTQIDLGFDAFWKIVEKTSYMDGAAMNQNKVKWQTWYLDYVARITKEDFDSIARQQKMQTINPKYVLRNYMAQLAIDAANKGDYTVVDELYQLLLKPYDEQPSYEKWYAKRPEWARTKVGCSMLSCSS